MHTRLILALGSAAWLMAVNLASAEEVGTDPEMATSGTQANVSGGNDTAMPGDESDSGVEFRRNHRGDKSRTGRNDNGNSSGGRGGGSRGGEGGEGGEGGGGGGGD